MRTVELGPIWSYIWFRTAKQKQKRKMSGIWVCFNFNKFQDYIPCVPLQALSMLRSMSVPLPQAQDQACFKVMHPSTCIVMHFSTYIVIHTILPFICILCYLLPFYLLRCAAVGIVVLRDVRRLRCVLTWAVVVWTPLTISAGFGCSVTYTISACLEFISSCVERAPGRL